MNSSQAEARASLHTAIDAIDTAGTFAVGGEAQLPLPGLRVNGDAIALPLQPAQASLLTLASEQAPFGKGAATVIDVSVRNCRQVDAAKVTLSAVWNRAIERLVRDAVGKLGVCGDVVAKLYKLVLYPPGGFFKRHKDTEKEEGMFGTLVVQLPAGFEGGELVVRHGGERMAFGFEEGSESLFYYVAFYADCEHEVGVVREGFRVCLVYNLVRVGGGVSSLREQDGVLEDLGKAVDLWEESEVDKMVMVLEHEYTEKNLAFGRLKGRDAVVVAMLRRSARFDLFLALVEKHEHGVAACDFGRSYRYGDWGDEGGAQHSMEDVLSTEVEIKKWVGEDDQRVELHGVTIDDEDMIDGDELFDDGKDPTREEYEDYTGNAGPMLDYWYHQAVLVMWPRSYGVTMLCESNFKAAVQLAMRRAKEGAHDAADTLQCIVEFASLNARRSQPMVAELLEVACQLKHIALIKTIVGFMMRANVKGTGCTSEKCAKVLAQAVGSLGWVNAEKLVLDVVYATQACDVGNCCTLSLSLRDSLHATHAAETVASAACKVLARFPLHDQAAAACARMLFTISSCTEAKKAFIARGSELSASALSAVIQILHKSSSDASTEQGFPQRFAHLTKTYISKAFSKKVVQESAAHAAPVWSILLGPKPRDDALLQLFTTAAINSNCGLLLKALLATPKTRTRVSDPFVTRIASRRAAQLQYRKPKAVSHRQSEAFVPRHPRVTEFLRSNRFSMEYKAFNDMTHAYNFAKKHFGRYNHIEEHDARAQVVQRGRDACVVITKVTAPNEKVMQHYNADQCELQNVRSVFLSRPTATADGDRTSCDIVDLTGD